MNYKSLITDFVVKLSSHTVEVAADWLPTGGHKSVSIWPKIAPWIFNTSSEPWHANLWSATEIGLAQYFLKASTKKRRIKKN